MGMALRTARQLVVLMVNEFQLYGTTWSELHKKSGLKPTAYKRAFNFAMEQNWFVGGGGKKGAPYYLNPDGCWRAALGPRTLTDQSGSGLPPEIGSARPNTDPMQTLDRIVASASEAIRHANKG
jgi:hypothetical protein